MNRPVEKIISKVILSDRTINIKLIGDSITHGEGGTGFEQNGEQFIEGYSRNNDGYCWANLFKEYMERFYNNIVKLYVKFIEANIDVIFVANIPASYKNEAVRDNLLRVFHMNDVNDIYMKASAECGFPFISLYNLFLEYCDLKDISVDSLLADGLHPNDEGYHLIFKLILREFGIGKAKKHFCG